MQSTFPVTLLFADGAACRLTAEVGAKLVDVATSAGVTLLTDCANGQCGSCTAQLVSGEIDLQDYDKAVLPDDDRATSAVLPCVCRLTGSCAIELPYSSTEALAEEVSPLRAQVVSVQSVATETIHLRLDVGRSIDFEPGQYVRIRPPGTDAWRSYSMANRPKEQFLDFFIRLVPNGVFSRWLVAAAPGDEVEVSTPHGSFFLRDEARPRLFVAGGTGIAPFLSMLRSTADQGCSHPTTVLIGARTSGHLFARDELKAYAASVPGLDLRFAVEEGTDPDSHTGYATDLLQGMKLPSSTRAHLCGPPAMVDAARRAAEAAGLQRQDVLCERFA